MSGSPEQVSIRVLDRDYQVLCAPEERRGLIDAALQLDRRMRAIRESGKLSSVEKIAVMCALNLVDELNAAEERARERARIDQQVLDLAARVGAEPTPE
ncbi:MAG: cell division protein ZapA [Wenzhouxiangellaceae bacterium]|nr:cell division protein ZapA [Wenzhouxiangellaceae bacterium]